MWRARTMTVNEEWVNLPVTFVWESGGDMPVAIGGGYVDVSFHPVSSAGGVSFDDSKMPRFVASNDPVMVVEVDDCITTLLFPFVTNKAELRYRNGHLEYLGGSRLLHHRVQRFRCSRRFDDRFSRGRRAMDHSCVKHCRAEYQGYITATCGFRDAFGFAFLANGFGSRSHHRGAELSRCMHRLRLRRAIVQRAPRVRK